MINEKFAQGAERMKRQLCGWMVCFSLLMCGQALPAEEIRVLDETIIKDPGSMMKDWLQNGLQQAFDRWQKRYDTLLTPEQITAYQKQMRADFLSHIGNFPERTPLNPKVTGTFAGDGFRVEKILFESQPQHYVTGLCFIPNSTKFQAPYPGVLVVCGHSDTGKGYDVYQKATALCALNGMVGFIIDPICQGERYDQLKPDGSALIPSTTDGHSILGLGAMLLGHNTARNELWDAMRALDYLQQRDDVQPEKLGVMGNSGGGTQSAQLLALEERIQAASPSCYLTSMSRLLAERGPQDAEQNIFGQLNWGLDHADYCTMRAPVPVLMNTATKDAFPIDGSWTSFRAGKRLFTRLGYSERIDLIEYDGPHGWHLPMREAAVRWMSRWLAGRDVDVREPEIQVLSLEDSFVTPKGQVMQLPGARSGHDLNLEEYNQLQAERTKIWEAPQTALAQVRKVTGIAALGQLPAVKARKLSDAKDGSLNVERWVLEPEEGIVLPALLYRPAQASKGHLLFLNEAGKQAEYKTAEGTFSARASAEQGYTVLALDLRGLGETKSIKANWYNTKFGEDAKLVMLAYLLEKNYVALRANDLLASARWFLENEKLPTDKPGLELVAIGLPGLPALHAAALEQQLFRQVTLADTLPSWKAILDSQTPYGQHVNSIHGAARVYELSDLAGVLGDRLKTIDPAQVNGTTAAK